MSRTEAAVPVPGENGPPRVESIRVRNYRALADVALEDVTPMTVLLGPNGSGKSTLFDVFSFLSECFQYGLRQAWDRRGRAKELKTRAGIGPVSIEIKYRERRGGTLITYHVAVDEEGPAGTAVVTDEWLQWRRGQSGKPFRFLHLQRGRGEATSGEVPDEKDERKSVELRAPDMLGVSTLGQFTEHPRVAALREFITDWYVSYLSVDSARSQPEAGPQERLSRTGDNLPNVIQYLKERHPHVLGGILATLRRRVPRLESVLADVMPDGRLLLQIKDAPFEQPVLSKYASDGTVKMLAYLAVLRDPDPPRFVGIEEPENHLHPKLLPELAEECREASARSQLVITTHSPFLLNGLRPEEVRVLYRDERGHTQIERAADIEGVPQFVDEGATLGHLWMEGHLGMGDPFADTAAQSRRKPRT